LRHDDYDLRVLSLAISSMDMFTTYLCVKRYGTIDVERNIFIRSLYSVLGDNVFPLWLFVEAPSIYIMSRIIRDVRERLNVSIPFEYILMSVFSYVVVNNVLCLVKE